ncbi:MAG: DUF1146 family protein [Candidatus Izemoplasmatales bacterium]
MSLNQMFFIVRIILTVVSTLFIFNAVQRIDLQKIFKQGSGNEIRLLMMVSSFILGYLFTDAIVSLFIELFSYL